jgi:hypothetical protein
MTLISTPNRGFGVFFHINFTSQECNGATILEFTGEVLPGEQGRLVANAEDTYHSSINIG